MKGLIRVIVTNEDTGEKAIREIPNTVTDCGRRFLDLYSGRLAKSVDLDGENGRTIGSINNNGIGFEASDLYRGILMYEDHIPTDITPSYFPVDRKIVGYGYFDFVQIGTQHNSLTTKGLIEHAANVFADNNKNYTGGEIHRSIKSLVRYFKGCPCGETYEVDSVIIPPYIYDNRAIDPSQMHVTSRKAPYILDTGRNNIFYYDKNNHCFYQYEYSSDNDGVNSILIYRINNVNLPPFANSILDNLTYGEKSTDRELVMTIANPFKELGTNLLNYGLDGYAYVTSQGVTISENNQFLMPYLKIDFKNGTYEEKNAIVPYSTIKGYTTNDGNAGCITSGRLFYIRKSIYEYNGNEYQRYYLVSVNLSNGAYYEAQLSEYQISSSAIFYVWYVLPSIRGVVVASGEYMGFGAVDYYDAGTYLESLRLQNYTAIGSSSTPPVRPYLPIDDDGSYVIQKIQNGTELLSVNPMYVGTYVNIDPPIYIGIGRVSIDIEYAMSE